MEVWMAYCYSYPYNGEDVDFRVLGIFTSREKAAEAMERNPRYRGRVWDLGADETVDEPFLGIRPIPLNRLEK